MRFLFLAAWLMAGVSHACTKPGLPPFDPNTYYAPLAGLSGGALRSELNRLLRGHIAYVYSPCTWEILAEADQDPGNPLNVITLYSQESIPKVERDAGGNTPDYWNREHVWPNGKGFASKDQHAYTDAHNLHAADKSVNADRESHDFVAGGLPASQPECVGCFEGNATWEPPDVVKGDVARMLFYMDVRYDGNDASNTPDLVLVDHATANGGTQMGYLCTLVDWHLADPVSAVETARNDVVYSWQGNRNPFVDRPALALALWGEACGVAPRPAAQPVPLPWAATVLLTVVILVLARDRLRHVD